MPERKVIMSIQADDKYCGVYCRLFDMDYGRCFFGKPRYIPARDLMERTQECVNAEIPQMGRK